MPINLDLDPEVWPDSVQFSIEVGELRRMKAEFEKMQQRAEAAETEAVNLRETLFGHPSGIPIDAYAAQCADERDKAEAKVERLRSALKQIVDLECRPFEFPADWRQQIRECLECQRYESHPVQQGICNEHRKPLYQRERHNARERENIGWRAKDIACAALTDKAE